MSEDRQASRQITQHKGQAAAAMALEQVIPQVQQELGALIKKPKLSTKLLSKPPFRFLHDIFFAVMRATGFGEGLYEEHELNGKVCMHTVQPTALSVCLSMCETTHSCSHTSILTPPLSVPLSPLLLHVV